MTSERLGEIEELCRMLPATLAGQQTVITELFTEVVRLRREHARTICQDFIDEVVEKGIRHFPEELLTQMHTILWQWRDMNPTAGTRD